MPTSYPCVPGHEIVGRVVGVGAGVTKFKKGELAAVGCMVDSDRGKGYADALDSATRGSYIEDARETQPSGGPRGPEIWAFSSTETAFEAFWINSSA